MPARGKPTTEAEKQQILNLHHQGLSRADIGRETRLSHSTVLKVLREAGIEIQPPRRRELTPELCEQVLAMYAEGERRAEIQRVTRLADQTILKILETAGVDIKRIRAAKNPQLPENAAGYSQRINESVEEYTTDRTAKAEQFIEIWQTSDSLTEVVNRTGMERKAAWQRANYYKKRGIPLKDMPHPVFRGGRKIDWSKLADYAAQFLSDEEGDNDE